MDLGWHLRTSSTFRCHSAYAASFGRISPRRWSHFTTHGISQRKWPNGRAGIWGAGASRRLTARAGKTLRCWAW